MPVVVEPSEGWATGSGPGAVTTFGRLFRGRSRYVWVGLLAVMVLFAVFGDRLAPIDPHDQSPRDRLQGPWTSTDAGFHLFGTDAVGRDLFGQIILGTRLTLVIALCAMAIGSAVGVAMGMVAGYHGGWVDRICGRIAEAQTAMPMFLVAILLVSLFGASVLNLILILPTLVWPTFARIVRAETIRMRTTGFVEAAVAVGGTGRWIMVRHLLPNLLPRIVALAVISTGQVMLSEAGLSFLGAGVQPPDTTWGLLVADGREYLAVAWWLTIIPGLFLAVTVLSLNMLGRTYTAEMGAAA
jgi:peptide/nickel transport system permease protein